MQAVKWYMLPFFDLKHPYLTRHLIAYIGNKRALLGFLHDAVSRICTDLDQERVVFLDPFAGSGAVARLARLMGLKVLANDWELYSYIINRAHLSVNAGEAAKLFADRGGYEEIFSFLNNLSPPPKPERYISRYYAPRNTAAADYRKERLFYTRENGLRIDALRSKIEELYPGFMQEESSRRKEKELLLASLLYQCATHTNTSGVFKACHKGFGGHSKDALKRIMNPIHPEMPVLIDSAERAEVFRLDAAQFCSARSGDICYIDPPYNQHQYGSNYHLLNTIALWDKPSADIDLNTAGVLKNKAAIRRDWVKTKSPYCYKQSAPEAFKALLSAIDCRYLLVSYNTEGIIPFGELTDMMASLGRLDLFTSDYIKYRGGETEHFPQGE
ncbi:MAG: DNA methyltransferase [Spirochaeta sp.]|nr:DNA methyltransferase [Spirochaeta sp.]